MEQIPDGWGKRLHEKADFAQSLAELSGAEGYTAESCRGRVRSLQLKLREASMHFRNAALVLRTAPRKVDQMQVSLNAAYEREHALITGAQPPPKPIAFFHGGATKIRAIASVHRTLDALEDLRAGNAEPARETYQELLEEHRDAGPERLALWNAGLAVAYIQLSQAREARRRLEVSGLHACDPCCRLLGRVQIAARLAHVYQFLDAREQAHEWLAFLRSCRCPPATRWAFIARARLLQRCSLELGRCVLC